MQQQNTWLDGLEASKILSIRPSRCAQLCRAGLVPYVTAVGGILIHKRELRAFELRFPELLEYLRAEKEVDNILEDGDLIFECINFPPPSTVKLLKCVERHEGSFPTRSAPRG